MESWINPELSSSSFSIGADSSDKQALIKSVYRQVLGNAHLMESERLLDTESLLCNGKISVRGFIGILAKSDLYRRLFFESSSQYRFIELNYKHLLGRAPQDQSEILYHVKIYNLQGYDAEIDSYLNSDEYLEAFGEDIVPYFRGYCTQAGGKNVDFNRAFKLSPSNASSDTYGQAKLITDIAANLPTRIQKFSSIKTTASSTYDKKYRIVVNKIRPGLKKVRGNTFYTVGYSQLSSQLKNIHRSGGKILSISEIGTKQFPFMNELPGNPTTPPPFMNELPGDPTTPPFMNELPGDPTTPPPYYE